MRALRDFLLYSGVLPGLAAAALVASTLVLLGASLPFAVPLMAWLGVSALYAADRTFATGPADAINQPSRTAWVVAHRSRLMAGIVVALAGVVVTLAGEPLRVALAVCVLGGIAVLKVVPWRRALAEEAGWQAWAKPVGGALVWTAGAVGLPLLYLSAHGLSAYGQGVPVVEALALATYRFGFLFANFVVSDWPDKAGDLAASRWTPAILCVGHQTEHQTGHQTGHQIRYVAAASLVVSIGSGMWLAVEAGVGVLLALDLVAPCGMLVLLRRPLPQQRGFYHLLDALVAWPLVPALLAVLVR